MKPRGIWPNESDEPEPFDEDGPVDTKESWAATVAWQRRCEERARAADPRRFGDVEALHGQEPDSRTLRECEAALANCEAA